MTGYRQHKPRFGLTKCPDLVDHYNVAAVAQANKTVRIIWALLATDTENLMRNTPQAQS